MVACCQISGTYINEDGTLDMKRYYSAVRSTVDHLLFYIEKTKPEGSKKSGINAITFDPLKICRCPCHQDGRQVMH